MLTPRDVEKVLSLLRRVYGCDRHRHVELPQRHQPRVPRRERRDHRDRHLRLDDDPQHGRDRRHVPVDRLPGVQGPLPRQPGGLAGRHRPGRPRARARPGPGAPRRVRRHARRPVEQRGRAVRAGQPDGGRSARTSRASPPSCSTPAASGSARPPGGPERGDVGSSPDRGLRLRGRRADGPARDRPPHARPNRRSTSATTRGPRTASAPTRRSWPSRPSRSTCSPSATSRPSSSPATPRPRSAIGALRRRYDLPILGVIRPGASAAALATRNRRVGVIATPATIRSHAYFSAIKDENPAVEVYEHATPTLVPLVEAGELSGPTAEAAVAEALAPLLGERDAAGEFDLPAAARRDDRHAAPRLHPLPAAAPDHRGPGRRRGRHRRLRDGDGLGARRAAGRSTASRRIRRRGADPPPADDRRRRHVPRPRRPAVRRRPSRTSSRSSSRSATR